MEPAPEPALNLGPQPDSSASELELKDVERHQLIGQILKAYKDHGFHKTLSPVGFSAVWLANIDCLRSLVESLETNFRAAHYELNCAPELVSCWTARCSTRQGTLKSVPSTPIQESSPQLLPGPQTLSRKRRRLDASPGDICLTNCHERDKKCVVTKSTNPTISTHAIPYSLNNLDQDVSNDFWLFLETFWGEDQTKKWREFIHTKTTESVENHMLLSPSAHAYWDKWLFTLEPVMMSTDKRKLFMRFHWLCPGNLDSLRMTTQALIDPDFAISHPTFRPAMDLSREGYDKSDTSIPNLRLLDCDSCNILQSGDLITVTTDDPESLPLPSFEILHLQWILHRVQALAAAAGFDDDYGLGEGSRVVSDEDISECECVDYYPRKHSVDPNVLPPSAHWQC